jgi:hypothetical protein
MTDYITLSIDGQETTSNSFIGLYEHGENAVGETYLSMSYNCDIVTMGEALILLASEFVDSYEKLGTAERIALSACFNDACPGLFGKAVAICSGQD